MTVSEPLLSDYRLPDTILPRRYELALVPDLESSSFTGTETIAIETTATTSSIVVNAVDLEIESVGISSGWENGGAPAACSTSYDAATERLTVHLPAPIEPGRHLLHFAFSGVLNDKLCGFYRSTFTDDSGAERVIATTQFEETDARRAFPCFDEPDKKAVFSITLDEPAGMLAVSNSREIASEALEGGGRRVHFADTIVMSTYLVAFVVGPLEATEAVVAGGVEIRGVTLPGKGHLAAAAIDCAAHALGFYAEYFSIPYPSDKLDLVALPDFAAGAMENLGCVTFREAILLADEATTSRPELQRLAEVVEHEIAHMWFGDLVTMRWWNGIWLNEAFATFMALLCQDDYRPEWNCFVGFARDKASALTVDGLHRTRPIEFPVVHPDEAAAMFDVLTYEKGASVLWMLERYVGAETFRAGVRRYLSSHLYGNTETTDLWDAIEAEVPEGAIRAVMDSWIFQGGYPLVRVEGGSDAATVELSQRPFAYLSEEPPPNGSAIGSDWLVPVILRQVDGSELRVILGSSPVTVPSGAGRVVANAGGAGFYRLSYDAPLLEELAGHLFDLQAGERFNLVADQWAVALAGLGELSQFLALVDALPAEREPDVWSVVIGALSLFDRAVAEEDRPTVSRYARRVLRPVLDAIGWEATPGEDEQLALLRASLVSALGIVGGDAEVVARARELFVADHDRHEAIDPNLTNSVLAVVTANATRAEFDQILDRYRHPDSPMDQIRHLNCLAALTDRELAAEVRELCRSEVKSQNAPYLLSGLLRGRAVGVDTWRFIAEHYGELSSRFPDNSIHRMLDGISALIELDPDGEAPLVAEVAAFCEANIEPARRRLVDQSLERLRINVAFARRERPSIATLLS